MAGRNLKENLPARNRKGAPTKQPSVTFKSKEIVSDSDVSENEPTPQHSKKEKTSQDKSKGSSRPAVATKVVSETHQVDHQVSDSSLASSKVETGSEVEEEDTTDEESSAEEEKPVLNNLAEDSTGEEDSTEEEESVKEGSPGKKDSTGSLGEEESSRENEGSTAENSSAEKAPTEKEGVIEEGSTEEETSDESDSANVPSSSTSTSPTQDHPGAPGQAVTSSTPALTSAFKVAPVSGIKRKAETELQRNSESGKEEEDGDEDEDEENESDEQEDESGSTSREGNDPLPKSTNDKPAAETANARKPSRAYEPPIGFKALRVSLAPLPDISQVLQASNLVGKQIWHITAPAELSLNSLAGFSERSLRDGSSIFSQRDKDYGLLQDPRQKDVALLLPSNDKNQYQSSQTSISAIYHIGQIVRLPNLEAAPLAYSASSTETTAPRHQQPAGLKMRFHPFGVSSDSDSDGGVRKRRSASAPSQSPVFRPPPVAAQSSKPKKKTHKGGAPGNQTDFSSPSKAKNSMGQHLTIQPNGADIMDIDPLQDNANPPEKPALPKKKKQKGNPSAQQVDSSSPSNPKGSSGPQATRPSNRSDKMEIDLAEKKESSPGKTKKSKRQKKSGELETAQNHVINGPETLNVDESTPRKSQVEISSNASQSTAHFNQSDEMDLDRAETLTSSLGEPIKFPKSKKSDPVTQDSTLFNGLNRPSADLPMIKQSQPENSNRRKLENSTEIPKALPEIPETPPKIDSKRTNIISLPKHGSQPKPSSTARVTNESPDSRSTTSETSNTRKHRKSTPASTSAIAIAKSPPTADPNRMEIDWPAIAPPAPRSNMEHSSNPQTLTPTASTTGETPAERLIRKEEKRRRKALQKQQLPGSSPPVNGKIPLSKTLNSDPPALPLAEYSAQLSRAGKSKPAISSQTILNSSQGLVAGQSWSQLTTGGQTSPLGKKKKTVRWSDPVGMANDWDTGTDRK